MSIKPIVLFLAAVAVTPAAAADKDWDRTAVRVTGGFGHFKYGMASQPVVEVMVETKKFKPARKFQVLILNALENTGDTGYSPELEAAFRDRITPKKTKFVTVLTAPPASPPEGDALEVTVRLKKVSERWAEVEYTGLDKTSGDVVLKATGKGFIREKKETEDLQALARSCFIPAEFK